MTDCDTLKADFIYWILRRRLTPAQYEWAFDEICPVQPPIDYSIPPAQHEFMSNEAVLAMLQRRTGAPLKWGPWWSPRQFPQVVRAARLALEQNEINVDQYTYVTWDFWINEYIYCVEEALKMWYVLQVKTGGEDSVSAALQRKSFLARVPKENQSIRSGGQWGLKEAILMPGYVFVNLDYTPENYYRVVEIGGVIRFLGTDNVPSPLTDLEAEWIKVMSGPAGQPLEPTKVQVLPDGSVKILSGVLLNFIGHPIKYDKHSRRATLEITMCGQSKQVTLSIEPVKEPLDLNGV